MRRKLRFWAKAGASKTLLSWIQHGVQFPFHSEPPPFHSQNPLWTPAEVDYWHSELLPKLLQEGAVRPVNTPTRYVSASRLEPKRSGGYRHIVDLRPVNAHLRVPKCKYETLSTLPFLAKPNDTAITMDMQSGYYALGIHADF